MAKTEKSNRTTGRLPRDMVIEAARQCFTELGVAGTRMDDVARRAGLSRTHLYTFVTGRAQLVELAAAARLRELGMMLGQRGLQTGGDVSEAIVDLVVATVLVGRDDTEFVMLADAMPRFAVNRLLTSETSPVHQVTTVIFGPLLGRALSEGRLRTDVPSAAIVEWLQSVVALLAGRDDLTVDQMHTMATRFAVRGLFR
jgi:AcrR family transcriptional regulator